MAGTAKMISVSVMRSAEEAYITGLGNATAPGAAAKNTVLTIIVGKIWTMIDRIRCIMGR